MASCSCGTRDKPKPVSPLSRGLRLLGCRMRLAFRNWADIFLMLGALGPYGPGAPLFWRWIFGICLKNHFNFSSCRRSYGRHFRNVPKCRFLSAGLAGKFRCGEPVAGMGRRDSASAFSAAAPRCVASLLACCAGKRFAFPQLRTLAGSNSSACPQESAPGS